MQIKELSQRTRVPAKTIRFYESIGLLPPPARATNNYRVYAAAAIERLRFIAGARSLNLRLAEIRTILGLRDSGQAPCERVLAALDQGLVDLDRRLADLLVLRAALDRLRRAGRQLPLDDVEGRTCVCQLIQTHSPTGPPEP